LCNNTEANVSTTSLREWHERLGHINKQSLCDAITNKAINGVNLSNKDDFFCKSCQLGKSHRLKFNKSKEKEEIWNPGEYIHSDVCRPFSVASIGGSKFLLFVDEASNYRIVYFLKHKSDVLDRFKDFERTVANKFGRKMKVLRADNGELERKVQPRTLPNKIERRKERTEPLWNPRGQ